MPWSAPAPQKPPPGWWVELENRRAERDFDLWVEGIKAARIARLLELAGQVERRARDALADQAMRDAELRQWGPAAEVDPEWQAFKRGAVGGEIEYRTGRILSVR